MVLLLAARTIVNINLGLYSRRWRNASVPDLERIVAAVVLGSLVSIVIFYGASTVAASHLGRPGSRARSGRSRRC